VKKSHEFLWEEEQETAFRNLKEAITSQPVLTLYDPARATKYTRMQAAKVLQAFYYRLKPVFFTAGFAQMREPLLKLCARSVSYYRVLGKIPHLSHWIRVCRGDRLQRGSNAQGIHCSTTSNCTLVATTTRVRLYTVQMQDPKIKDIFEVFANKDASNQWSQIKTDYVICKSRLY